MNRLLRHRLSPTEASDTWGVGGLTLTGGMSLAPRSEQSSRPVPEGTGLDAVPVKVRRTGRPPRAKGIYHVGCTDYPDPTYP